jgi:hypothetical protein
MKGMADALSDLDESVSNCTLVLNLLRGPNKGYVHLKTFLKQTVSFPSFHDVRNDLLLEEITMSMEAAFDSATIFAASIRQQSRPLPSTTSLATLLTSPRSLPPFGGGSHQHCNNCCFGSTTTSPTG